MPLSFVKGENWDRSFRFFPLQFPFFQNYGWEKGFCIVEWLRGERTDP